MTAFLATCRCSLKALVAAGAVGTAGMVLADTSPYAGQDQRPIAALSSQDIEALLAGQGWGFAKPAELNGYPGPSHVLDLAEDLDLSAQQRAQVQRIFDRMQTEAQALGAQYVAAESALDAAFAANAITAEQLTVLTGQAAMIEAQLRRVHLAAHLETAPVLTRHQTMIYNKARGYGEGAGPSQHDGH
ncbi:hypothetical protein [Puniceibacterium confluentis]|uniref:hypothetical protein n=1 Tax=Puniceibacterium confluentis TaxID=1958944 RepID=UPI0011B6318B|nr:hypothetical protein [Puniceibacterium confluentis]